MLGGALQDSFPAGSVHVSMFNIVVMLISALGGLLASAGVGLLVLVRANRHWKQNLAIIAVLYAIGVVWGLIVNALGIVF